MRNEERPVKYKVIQIIKSLDQEALTTLHILNDLLTQYKRPTGSIELSELQQVIGGRNSSAISSLQTYCLIRIETPKKGPRTVFMDELGAEVVRCTSFLYMR